MLDRKKIEGVIGKGFADRLDEELFSLGSTLISRRVMVEELGCANFIAAAKLGKVLNRLKVTTVKQLFNTDPISLARSKGVGEASLFVAMCILDWGQYDVLKWWGYNDKSVKFSTFKHQLVNRAKRRGHE